MELAAKYVYTVYRERSFTAAAKALYISQPALSAAIARLEKDLDIRIFDRTTIPLSLTPQGKIYLESIQEIMESESNMRRRIRELSDMSYGSLSIGGTIYSFYPVMSRICGEFYRRYPEIKVSLDIGTTGQSTDHWEKMKRDELDLILTHTSPYSKYVFEPLFDERYIIVMRSDMKGADALKHLAITREELLSGNYDASREIEDMSVFQDIEFLPYETISTSRKMTLLLGDYRTAGYTITNSRHSMMHYHLMCAGVGALMTTDIQIAYTPHEQENLLFFVPKSRNSYRTVYLTRTHGSLNNPIIRNFVQLAKEMCTPDKIFDFNSPDT